MKKFTILLLILLFATACTNSQVETTDSVQNGVDIDLGTEQTQPIETEAITATEDAEATSDKLAGIDFENINPNSFEPLVDQYDTAVLETNMGSITVKFYTEDSPFTVNNFMNLASIGFYDNTKFHRVIKDFMIQGGDPNSIDDDWSDDGRGGPSYRFKDEFNTHKIVRGSLAMANSGPNTNGSQFFIVTAEATPWLDGKHTNFGYVVDGMEVVDRIESMQTGANDHPTEDVIIESIVLK